MFTRRCAKFSVGFGTGRPFLSCVTGKLIGRSAPPPQEQSSEHVARLERGQAVCLNWHLLFRLRASLPPRPRRLRPADRIRMSVP